MVPLPSTSKGATYPTAVPNVSDMGLLKDGCCMAIQDGHHQSRSIEMLRKSDDVKLAVEQLHRCYEILVDGTPILRALSIKLIMMVNISTT